MTAREEFLTIAHAALAGDPGLETLKVSGYGPDFQYFVKTGSLPSKLAHTEYHPAPSFKREDLLKLLATATRAHWQRGRLPTRANIDDLRNYFAKHCQGPIDCGPGWLDLLFSVFHITVGMGAKDWWTYDIKEKYGGLRIAYSAGPGLTTESLERLDRVVDAAEHLSEHICEECGAPGRIKDGGWIRTLCDEHAHV